MTVRVIRQHAKRWYESPRLAYKVVGSSAVKKLEVNVTGSSRPLKGSRLSAPVRKVLRGLRDKPEKTRILDFGSGTWLRYVHEIQRVLPDREFFFVEYPQAFEGKDPAIRAGMTKANAGGTFWTPGDLVKRKNNREYFHVILVVNVFNTMPEPGFRAGAFKALVKHLYPGGWLLVYQRKWASTDLPTSPSSSFEYEDGWMLPHQRHAYSTYRARTGYSWFNGRAAEHGLRHLPRRIKMTSSNTIFRIWQKKL